MKSLISTSELAFMMTGLKDVLKYLLKLLGLCGVNYVFTGVLR